MNIKKHNIFLLIGGILFFAFFIHYTLYVRAAGSSDLGLQIQGIGIRHGTPDNKNLGIITASGVTQDISGQFIDYFWVEDIQGYKTGHYTTIQCDGVYGPGGTRLTGIYLKAGNTTPTLILGTTGNVLIATGLYVYASILSPMTYIYKPTSGSMGPVNRYGDKPRLKITIPGGTPPGTYSGTIVFSLYMY